MLTSLTLASRLCLYSAEGAPVDKDSRVEFGKAISSTVSPNDIFGLVFDSKNGMEIGQLFRRAEACRARAYQVEVKKCRQKIKDAGEVILFRVNLASDLLIQAKYSVLGFLAPCVAVPLWLILRFAAAARSS